jgi:branched-chain amino acid transport system ATP-binding protein
MSALLRLDGVEAGYGDLTAIAGISLEVRQGEAVALIGSNGAGKTTTLRAISGLLPVRAGRIELEGERLDGLGSAAIVARGIAHVPEGRQLFPTLTVRDNLELGARAAPSRRDGLDVVFTLFPRLRERQRQLAGTLSGGEQQMCAIGRGLMARPRILLLDEPSLGLAPLVVREILKTVRALRDDGVSILLVEQNARAALEISDHGYVLETGEIAFAGRSSALADDRRVQAAYLGGGGEPA